MWELTLNVPQFSDFEKCSWHPEVLFQNFGWSQNFCEPLDFRIFTSASIKHFSQIVICFFLHFVQYCYQFALFFSLYIVYNMSYFCVISFLITGQLVTSYTTWRNSAEYRTNFLALKTVSSEQGTTEQGCLCSYHSFSVSVDMLERMEDC